MKKRKAPILLWSILVVFGGAVVLFGMNQLQDSTPQAPPQPDYMADKGREAPSKDDVAKTLQASTQGVTKEPPKESKKDDILPPALAKATVPTIAVAPKGANPEKPHFDPGATVSSQWYSKEHK